MANLKITEQQAKDLLAARTLSTSQRKAAKKRIFADIRRSLGVSNSTKLGVNIVNSSSPRYLCLYDKRTRNLLSDGVPEPTMSVGNVSQAAPAPVAPAPVAPAAVAKPAAKAPAKAAKPAAKAPAKAPAKAK